MGKGLPKIMSSILYWSLPSAWHLPQSPFQVLSGQSLLSGLTLPPPQGYMGQSLTSSSLLASACSSLSLLSQENPHLFPYLPLPTSFSSLSHPNFSKREPIFDVMSSTSAFCLTCLPQGSSSKCSPLCLESSWLPTPPQSCLHCRLEMQLKLSQRDANLAPLNPVNTDWGGNSPNLFLNVIPKYDSPPKKRAINSEMANRFNVEYQLQLIDSGCLECCVEYVSEDAPRLEEKDCWD